MTWINNIYKKVTIPNWTHSLYVLHLYPHQFPREVHAIWHPMKFQSDLLVSPRSPKRRKCKNNYRMITKRFGRYHIWKWGYLEILLVCMISSSMRQEDVVSDNVWFNRWISFLTKQMTKNRTSPGSLYSQVITLEGITMRLVEGDPVLNSISKSLEAGEGIIFKVFSTSDWGNYKLSKISTLAYITFSVTDITTLTLSVCSTTLHICLQASAEDPNDIELQKAVSLIGKNSLTFQ